MSGDDTSYAPKSPDLSSFFSAGPTQPAPQFNLPPQQRSPPPDHGSHHPHLNYNSTASPPYGYGHGGAPYAPPPAPHRPLHQQQQQQQPHHPQLSPAAADQQHIKSEFQRPYHPGPIHQHHQPPHPYLAQSPHAAPHAELGYEYGLQPQPYHPSPYDRPFADQHTQQQPFLGQSPYPQQQQPYPPQPQGLPGEPLAPSHAAAQIKAEPALDSEMPPRRAAAAPPAPVVEPSPVRTKFPTARIKRIMQADEEVGKVAQQTPIAVGKALEMFMVQMVTKSAEAAKDKGSKRVNAQMLKQVVETDEQWDFLREIVSRVGDEKEGGRAKAKAESDTDEEPEEPKKKPRGGRRKKE